MVIDVCYQKKKWIDFTMTFNFIWFGWFCNNIIQLPCKIWNDMYDAKNADKKLILYGGNK